MKQDRTPSGIASPWTAKKPVEPVVEEPPSVREAPHYDIEFEGRGWQMIVGVYSTDKDQNRIVGYAQEELKNCLTELLKQTRFQKELERQHIVTANVNPLWPKVSLQFKELTLHVKAASFDPKLALAFAMDRLAYTCRLCAMADRQCAKILKDHQITIAEKV